MKAFSLVQLAWIVGIAAAVTYASNHDVPLIGSGVRRAIG